MKSAHIRICNALWKLVGYNLKEVDFLTLNRAFKKMCTILKKPYDIATSSLI